MMLPWPRTKEPGDGDERSSKLRMLVMPTINEARTELGLPPGEEVVKGTRMTG